MSTCLSFEEANLASFIGISLYLLFSQLCHNEAYLILENKSMFKYMLYQSCSVQNL